MQVNEAQPEVNLVTLAVLPIAALIPRLILAYFAYRPVPVLAETRAVV